MATPITAFGRAALFASVLAAGSAQAAVTVLTFDELKDNEAIGSFYNGGTGDLGTGPGPSYGVVFSANALALIDVDFDNNASGNFANEPSPNAVMYFLEGGSVYMNVPAGFDTGFSFYYSSSLDASISVFDGIDGTGNVLATFALPANFQDDGCQGDPTGLFCHWDPVGTSFGGIARSIGFGGEINFVGFDNITFGSETPVNVAEPNSLALLGLGLLGLAGLAGRRRKAV